MSLLRDTPAPYAVATTARALQQREIDQRARNALNTRLAQLEHQHQEFTRTLIAVERAVRWLPERHRAIARRRLREMGHDEQLDAFAGLHDVICGEAAA